MEDIITQIEIKKIFKAKNPKLFKYIPNFIFNTIEKHLHQSEINYVLKTYHNSKGKDFVNDVLTYFNFNANCFGIEKLNFNNKYIFASNHPLGGLESLALLKIISEKDENVKFIVNDILLNLKNFDPLFVPVNKLGKNPRAYSEIIDNTFASDNQVLIFPAGLVSRKNNGEIKDLEWKKGFISKAIAHKKNIVPVFISGQNSNKFYNIANFRKKIGIKANIEMFWLADEMFNQKNKTINIYFGDPIDYNFFDKTKRNEDWAQWVKEKVYELTIS